MTPVSLGVRGEGVTTPVSLGVKGLGVATPVPVGVRGDGVIAPVDKPPGSPGAGDGVGQSICQFTQVQEG